VEGALAYCCGRVALFHSRIWVERGRGLSSKNMGIGVGGYPAVEGSYVGCSVRVGPFRMLVERGGVFLSVGGLMHPIPWS
jgi:hypothetical protein